MEHIGDRCRPGRRSGGKQPPQVAYRRIELAYVFGNERTCERTREHAPLSLSSRLGECESERKEAAGDRTP